MLERLVRAEHPAHAYFFYGPDLAARSSAIAGIVRAASGSAQPLAVALDVATPLTRDGGSRSEISIDDIRELKRLFSVAAAGGSWRIAVIGDADRLSPEAANAFLKLLEEPGERTLFIVTAETREAVLPTIVSRTQPVFFGGAHAESSEVAALKKEIKRHASGNGLPELFLISRDAAFDRGRQRECIGALAGYARDRMIERPDSAASAAFARRVLEIAGIVATTNVNPRLALDAAFVAAVRSAAANDRPL